MKKLRNLLRSNHGLSLVEVVCAVAILGIVISAVGGAMIVSAKNYQKGTTEFEVQQEAQLTTNMIGNLLVDAVDVEWDAATKTLTIKREGVTYTIVHQADNSLWYTEAITGGDTVSGCLAEGVASFDVDASKFAKNKNVKIELTVTRDGKSYATSYNTTTRNGEVEDSLGAGEYAAIIVDNKLVLEPGQKYTIGATVMGMTVEQAGGLEWVLESGADATKVSSNNYEAVIEVDDDATGTFIITVMTGGYQKDADGNATSLRLDTKTIQVDIRRVNDMTLTPVMNGSEGMAGTVYTVYANVVASNPDKAIGKNYDIAPYEYKDPRYVDFAISMEGMEAGKTIDDYICNVVYKEDVAAPYVTFESSVNMPSGSKITVTATAKHPEGEWEGTYYNKASVQSAYDNPYTPSVVRTCEFTKAATEYSDITVEDNIIVEPGQSYTVSVSMDGLSAEQAGGLVWTLADGSAATLVSSDNTGATIKVDDSATAAFDLTVKTAGCKTDDAGNATTEPYDTETITFDIRRVNALTLTPSFTGTAGAAGAVYTITAEATGTNFAEDNEDYDKTPYAYIDPRYVDFDIAITGMASGKSVSDYVSVTTQDEDVESPELVFELLEDLPSGAELTVTATAKHPDGEWESTYYNKASVQNSTDDPYDTITAVYKTSKAAENAVIIKEGAIMRGQSFVSYDGCLITNPTIADSAAQIAVRNKGNNGTGYDCANRWYFRYKEYGADDSTFSQYIQLTGDNLFPTFTSGTLTELFHPNKSYEIQFILAFVDEDKKKLIWPTDDGLLDPTKNYGFYEHGITAGWYDSTSEDGYLYNYGGECLYDASSVGFANYGGVYLMRKATNCFFDAPGYTYGTNVYFVTPQSTSTTNPETTVTGVGTFAAPFTATTSNRANLWFMTSHLFKGAYYFDMILEKYDASSTSWVDVTSDLSSYMQTTGQKQNSFFMIESFKTVGKYRIHIALTNTNADGSENIQARYRNLTAGDVFTPLAVGDAIAVTEGVHMCGTNEAGEEVGYIYLMIQ